MLLFKVTYMCQDYFRNFLTVNDFKIFECADSTTAAAVIF